VGAVFSGSAFAGGGDWDPLVMAASVPLAGSSSGLFEEAQQFHRERKHHGRVLLRGDFDDRLE
jgi:hypothetical protein